jgi:phenylacetyl-CoA:acceptor oxidoreductase
MLLGAHLLAVLVGALEVPGGTIGTTVRLARPMSHRHESVTARAAVDGFMHYGLNPTAKGVWSPKPNIRNAYRTMVPLASDGPWSQALGPTHFSWMFLDETPEGLPRVTPPDLWFVYRTNPAISFWDTAGGGREDGAFPLRRRLRLHARRDQSLRRHPAARRDRPREPAADPHRRHQVR